MIQKQRKRTEWNRDIFVRISFYLRSFCEKDWSRWKMIYQMCILIILFPWFLFVSKRWAIWFRTKSADDKMFDDGIFTDDVFSIFAKLDFRKEPEKVVTKFFWCKRLYEKDAITVLKSTNQGSNYVSDTNQSLLLPLVCIPDKLTKSFPGLDVPPKVTTNRVIDSLIQ